MKILLTGAFGNIGFSTLQELLKQGHTVRSFDLKNKQTEKKARQVAGKTEIIWGDIRDAQHVASLVVDQDVIVHLAAILPPEVDERLEEAAAVNVEGTRSLLQAAKQQPRPPKFLFSSSLDVFGFTQDQPPPRKVTDPVVATDAYTTHKLEDEANDYHVWAGLVDLSVRGCAAAGGAQAASYHVSHSPGYSVRHAAHDGCRASDCQRPGA